MLKLSGHAQSDQPVPTMIGGKLGVQILVWVPGTMDFLLRAKPIQIKTLDPNSDNLRILKQEIPGCFIVYRRYTDAQVQLLVNPIQGAHAFADAVLASLGPSLQYVDVVEGLNECGLWNDADRYSLWTAEYARRMQSEGVKTVAYNFPVGNPSGYYTGNGEAHPDEFRAGLLAYWQHYFDGLRESDYLGLHEYWAPKPQTNAKWLSLRHRMVWDTLPADCRKPILITECGFDAGIIGQTDATKCGWRENGLSESAYISQLDWWLTEVNKDDYVLGAHIFHAGG